MPHKSITQGPVHYVTASLADKKSSPRSQIHPSRCSKPKVKGTATATVNIDYISLKWPFTETYDLDAASTQSTTWNCQAQDLASLAGVEAPYLGVYQNKGDSTQEYRKSRELQIHKANLTSIRASGASTPAHSTKHATKIDLLALIPPSALTPYLPEVTTALELIHIYFLEVPSAKLMFDQQAVVRRYRESTLPNQVLLAILSLASLYLRSDIVSQSDKSKSSDGTDVSRQGRLWADIASQMVLTTADITSLMAVRTCEQLSMYWYAVGDKDRADCHAEIAYQLYRVLVTPSLRTQRSSSLERAMHLHHCIGDYQAATNFRLLYPQLSSALNDKGLLNSNTNSGLDRENDWNNQALPAHFSTSTYAVGTVALWRESICLVQQLIHSPIFLNHEFSELDLKTRLFHEDIPSALKADDLMDYLLGGPTQDAKLCFTIVHCANMICLHSSKVQALVKLPQSSDDNASANIVAEKARLAGDLIHEHILQYPRQRKTPPMAGYCVFVIGSVHAHMNEFRDGTGWSQPWINGVSCLLLLEHMSTYWPVMKEMCISLRKRFSYSDPNMMTISTDLLWQLAGFQNTWSPSQSDLYTSGFFSIPYSASFVHEILGINEDTSGLEELSSDGDTSQASWTSSSSVFDATSLHAPGSKASSKNFGFGFRQITGAMGTNPPTFNFEANLLGVIQPAYR